MWPDILLKIVGTAVISVTSVALAAWALRFREREKASRERPDRPLKRRRSRLLRIAKWTGLVVCVVLGGAWIASLFIRVSWNSKPERRVYHLQNGAAGYTSYAGAGVVWEITKPIAIEFRRPRWWPRWWAIAGLHGGDLPLWIPLLIVAIPAAFLFYRDRRRFRPGHCQACGYDLTGNVSGVCPECGTKA